MSEKLEKPVKTYMVDIFILSLFPLLMSGFLFLVDKIEQSVIALILGLFMILIAPRVDFMLAIIKKKSDARSGAGLWLSGIFMTFLSIILIFHLFFTFNNVYQLIIVLLPSIVWIMSGNYIVDSRLKEKMDKELKEKENRE